MANDPKTSIDMTYVELDAKYLTDLPSVIAHEYNRIEELLSEGQPYGALIQLRDTAEVLFKFYVSAGLALLTSKNDKSRKEIQLLYHMTGAKLSFGDWAEAAEKMISFPSLRQDFKDIYKVLSSLRAKKIVGWRNRCLAHGALGYADSNEFQEEFIERFSQIQEAVRDISRFAKNIILIDIEEHETFELCGIDASLADDLHCDNKGLYIRLVRTDSVVPLYPFISVDNGRIFFFDDYFPHVEEADILNYFWGEKKEIIGRENDIVREIHAIFEDASRGVLSEEKVRADKTAVDKEAFSLNVIKSFEENISVQKTIPFEAVESWLCDKLEEDEKGIYLITGPGGSGKTTVVQQFNVNNKNSHRILMIPQTMVCAIYINSTYRSKRNLLLNSLDSALNEGMISVADTHIHHDSIDIPNEIARVLQEVLAQHNNAENSNDRLVVFIDGIDELPEDESSFIELLPNKAALGFGVYIVLTSRTKEEAPEYVNNKLYRLIPEKKSHYALSDGGQINSIMSVYASKFYPEIQNVESIIKKANNNFSHYKLLLSLCKLQGEDAIIGGTFKDAINDYFIKMNRVYTKQYNRSFFEILFILLTGDVGYSLEDIALLLDIKQPVSFELLGYLSDFDGIITYDRSKANTAIKIHAAVEESLDWTEAYIMDAQGRLDNKWAKQLRSIINKRSTNGAFSRKEIRFLEILFTENFLMNMPKLGAELTAKDYISLYEGLEGSNRNELPEDLERFYLSIISDIGYLKESKEKFIATNFFISLLDINDWALKESMLEEKNRKIDIAIEEYYSDARTIYYSSMQEGEKRRAQNGDNSTNYYYQLAIGADNASARFSRKLISIYMLFENYDKAISSAKRYLKDTDDSLVMAFTNKAENRKAFCWGAIAVALEMQGKKADAEKARNNEQLHSNSFAPLSDGMQIVPKLRKANEEFLNLMLKNGDGIEIDHIAAEIESLASQYASTEKSGKMSDEIAWDSIVPLFYLAIRIDSNTEESAARKFDWGRRAVNALKKYPVRVWNVKKRISTLFLLSVLFFDMQYEGDLEYIKQNIKLFLNDEKAVYKAIDELENALKDKLIHEYSLMMYILQEMDRKDSKRYYNKLSVAEKQYAKLYLSMAKRYYNGKQ